MDRLAANIRRLRLRRGLTLREAAAQAGVTLNTWARWERAERTPKLERWDRIAAVLGVTAPTLLR